MFWRSMWAAPAYMLWYGFVWYGMVLYGMVWYGMVWNVAVRYDMVFAEAFAAHTFQGQCTEVTFLRYGTVWYGMVQYGMVWYGTVWYGMIWYTVVWYGMAPIQPSVRQTSGVLAAEGSWEVSKVKPENKDRFSIVVAPWCYSIWHS